MSFRPLPAASSRFSMAGKSHFFLERTGPSEQPGDEGVFRLIPLLEAERTATFIITLHTVNLDLVQVSECGNRRCKAGVGCLKRTTHGVVGANLFPGSVPVSSVREKTGGQYFLTASQVPDPTLGTQIAFPMPSKLPREGLASQARALSRPPPCQPRRARRAFEIGRLSLRKGRGVRLRIE